MAGLPFQSRPDGAARCGQQQPHIAQPLSARIVAHSVENAICSFLSDGVSNGSGCKCHVRDQSIRQCQKADLTCQVRWDDFSWGCSVRWGKDPRISVFRSTFSKTDLSRTTWTLSYRWTPWDDLDLLFLMVEWVYLAEGNCPFHFQSISKPAVVVNVSSLWHRAGVQDGLRLQEPHCPGEAPLQEWRGDSCHGVSPVPGGQWAGTAEPL